MTREAVESGLYRIVDDLLAAVREEFDAVRALRRNRPSGPAGNAINELATNSDVLDRYVIEPEIERHRRDARQRMSITLDSAEHGEPIDAYRDSLLDADVYYGELGSDVDRGTREAVAEAVVGRYRTVAESVAPVLDALETDLWPAITNALSGEAALDLVDANCSFAAEMREYRGAFSFATRLDPRDLLGARGTLLPAIEVEYTDESLRAMGRAETRVRRDLSREVERRYAE
jgi:hypothetical protein